MINDETDTIGMYDYFHTHALISDETREQIQKHCDFSPNATEANAECKKVTKHVDELYQEIDVYNIYAPICLNSDLTSKPKRMVDL